jgi:hypothetical protein
MLLLLIGDLKLNLCEGEMKFEDIMNEWEKDSKIDSVKLDQTSVETAKLHAKYLRLYANAKLKLKDAEFKQKILLKDKWLYYEGKMSKEDIGIINGEDQKVLLSNENRQGRALPFYFYALDVRKEFLLERTFI